MSFNLNSSTYSLKAPSRTKSRSRHTTLSNYSGSQNQSPPSSNFRRVNKAQSQTFKNTHETDEFEEVSSDFVVLNDSVDPTANFNSGLEIIYHENGCPLAVNTLVKVIKTNQLAIQMSGGAYFTKYGTCFVSSNVNPNFANMTLSPNSSISSARAKRRYLCLTEGKLRVGTILPHINLNSLYDSEQKYMEGDELDSDSVSFQQTYYIQRLRTIRFVSLNSNTVVLVFLVPKRSKAKTAFGETLVKNTLKRMKKFDSSANMLGLSTKRKQKAQQQQQQQQKQQQASQNLNKFYETAVDSDNLSTNSLLSRNSTRSLNSAKTQQQQQEEVNGNTLFRFRLHSTNSTTLGRTLSKTSSMLFRSKNKNKNKKRQTKKDKKAAAKQKLQQRAEPESESVTLPEMENLTPAQVQSSPKKTNGKNKELMKHQSQLTQLQKSQSLNNLQLTKAQRNKLQLRNLPPRVGTQVSTVSSQNLSVNNTSFNSVTSNFTDSEQETEQSDFEQESEQKNNNNGNHRGRENKDKENKITINVNVSGLDVEVQTTKKTQDELLISDEIEEESIELRFESAELCQDWVKHLLVEVENQAKMFTAYADILEEQLKDNNNKKTKRSSDRMTKSSEINFEVFLRYAVDLLTLCKGIRNKSVWQARERLAIFLEQDTRTKAQREEARLWFELSFQLRNNPNNNNTSESPKVEVRDTKLSTKSSGSITSFQSMFTKFSDEPTLTRDIYKQHSQLNAHQKPRTRDEAYEKLVLFLEQFALGRKVGSIENMAKSMFERYELPELSKRLEHEFGRVPEGFENYLAETEESALECLQREATELAKGIRKGGNNGRKHNMKQY